MIVATQLLETPRLSVIVTAMAPGLTVFQNVQVSDVGTVSIRYHFTHFHQFYAGDSSNIIIMIVVPIIVTVVSGIIIVIAVTVCYNYLSRRRIRRHNNNNTVIDIDLHIVPLQCKCKT